MKEFLDFVLQHWILSSLFVILFIAVIVEEARAKGLGSGMLISSQKLTQLINHEDAVVVDIRDGNAYKDGHIINAVNIPEEVLKRDKDKLNKYKDKLVVLMCANGQKSMSLASKLRKDGFPKIHVLQSGIGAWKSAGYPITKK